MTDQIKEIELNIEEAREFIKLEEVSAPGLQEGKYQDAIVKTLSGIGQLQQFFNKVSHQAEMARSSIEDSENALEELNNEIINGEVH